MQWTENEKEKKFSTPKNPDYNTVTHFAQQTCSSASKNGNEYSIKKRQFLLLFHRNELNNMRFKQQQQKTHAQ